MNTLAHSGVFWVSLIAGLVLIYFLPTMIGFIRKVESLGLLIFLNVLPTGVGWIAAMVMASMSPRPEPPLTYVAYRCLPVSAGSERQLATAARMAGCHAVVRHERLTTLAASVDCSHAPLGVSAVLALAPGRSPWRLQSAHG